MGVRNTLTLAVAAALVFVGCQLAESFSEMHATRDVVVERVDAQDVAITVVNGTHLRVTVTNPRSGPLDLDPPDPAVAEALVTDLPLPAGVETVSVSIARSRHFGCVRTSRTTAFGPWNAADLQSNAADQPAEPSSDAVPTTE